MKALSLTQPWATLVAIGAKKFETRSWKTEYRGPLAIHASQGFGKESLNAMALPEFRKALTPAGFHYLGDMPRGAVIAVCELVDVIPTVPALDWKLILGTGREDDFALTKQEEAFGDYNAGRYVWILKNVRRLPDPVPAKGALSLWEWEAPRG